jgi:CRP-like cAMP-binding protein/molybdopterin/thiamine biosynthesis adenylyltransferase
MSHSRLPEQDGPRSESGRAEQEVLRGASLLIAGCGPVGAQVATALVEGGAEWLTLADPERQSTRQSAPLTDHLFDVNPFATIETASITSDDVDSLISNADLVIDSLDVTTRDSLRLRYLLHTTAKRHSTPVLTALDTGESGLAIVYDYRDSNQPVLDGVVSETDIPAVDTIDVLQKMIRQSQTPGRSDELSITDCTDSGECALRLSGVIADQIVYDVLFKRPLDRLTMVDAEISQRSPGLGILAAGRKIVAMYTLRRKLRDVRRKEKPAAFSPLHDEIFKDLRPYMEERTYETGSVVIRQGDPADDFFVLVSGRVQVEHEEHEEHDAPDDFDYEPISTYTVIADLGPGDFFGEMALLSDAPRNASVVVTERCQVLALSRGAFNLYLEESQPAFQRLREIALARRYENQETYGF